MTKLPVPPRIEIEWRQSSPGGYPGWIVLLLPLVLGAFCALFWLGAG